MLCVVTEETERVISERHVATLRDLASNLASSSTEDEVLKVVEEALRRNSRDLPFTLLTYMAAMAMAATARRVSRDPSASATDTRCS
jgi:hypothetical protein